MNIVGISSHFHNSSCALIKQGNLVAAASEERFSRFKNDPRLPIRSFRYCLEESGLSIDEIDCVAYYEQPEKKLTRQLCARMNRHIDKGFNWVDCKRPLREISELLGYEGEVKCFDHHMSHAAASFFFSGFDDAAILTADAVGEWATTTLGQARGSTIELFHEMTFPHSIGLLYSTITNYLGFEVLSGEYKVMGLAPYGVDRFSDEVSQLFDLQTVGGSAGGVSFSLDMRYFDFGRMDRMFTDRFVSLIGFPPREPEAAIEQHHKDLARSLQDALERIMLTHVRQLRLLVDSENLCLSGGVALNCVANRAIRKDAAFENIFIPPAPGDAGGALGAAALAYAELTGERHSTSRLRHAYLGPKFDNEDIRALLDAMEIAAEDFSTDPTAWANAVVDRIVEGKIIGLFLGRMEFGPRALGARSIIADPRAPGMRDRINHAVKKREAFRPFAPAILAEHAAGHIDLEVPSPFMLETCEVTSDLELPGVTHVDRSTRPQTVTREANPTLHALLTTFFQRTGCPLLLNTSFNVRGEPIVCTPLDALRCFGNSEMDGVVLEGFLVDRHRLPPLFAQMAQQEHDAILPPRDLFTGRSTEAVYTFI